MWRFLILAFSILFVGVQSARADKVVVQVGGGHHHNGYYHRDGRERVFVYKHYWHHRRWRHVYLAPEFTAYLDPLPYKSPGYQIVTVYFGDGSSLENVYVYNRDQIELPPRYDGRKIVKVVVVN